MHIISISTEVYFYFVKHDYRLIEEQYNWLINDLKVSFIIIVMYIVCYIGPLVQNYCNLMETFVQTSLYIIIY